MSSYDVLIIGGGPNGLACAAVLARAGRKVAVVESRNVFGGQAAGEEFHPGYFSPGIHHDTSQLRPFVIEALDLPTCGLKPNSEPEDVWVMDLEGHALQVTASGEHLSADDRRGLSEWDAFLNKARPFVVELLDHQPRNLLRSLRGDWKPFLKPGWKFRRLGGDFMLELLRVPPMCAADWVSEYVKDERLRAHLAYDGIIRSFTGPWSPGTAGDLLLHRAQAGPGIQGGAKAVADALEQAARRAGVTLLAEHHVEEILVEHDQVTGIRTSQGRSLTAGVVVATCDPRRTFGELLDPVHVPYPVTHDVATFRGEGIAAKVHMALNAPVTWKGIASGHPTRVRIMDSLDALERSFDPAKYGSLCERPALDIVISKNQDSANAPSGHAVLSAWVHGVPYALDGGWDGAGRERLKNAVLSVLTGVTSGLGESLVALEVLAPPDLEARYHTYHGHIFHGDHALDQILVRPVPGCDQYRTFLPGLTLGGSGSFPGGGLTGAPGVLSARSILAG